MYAISLMISLAGILLCALVGIVTCLATISSAAADAPTHAYRGNQSALMTP